MWGPLLSFAWFCLVLPKQAAWAAHFCLVRPAMLRSCLVPGWFAPARL